MHIIFGILGLALLFFTVYKAYNESGFSFSSINPFLWYRRSQFRKQQNRHPLYCLDDPHDVRNIMIQALFDLTDKPKAEKQQALNNFYIEQLGMSAHEAEQTIRSNSFLIDGKKVQLSDIPHIIERSKDDFSEEQISKTIKLMKSVEPSENSEAFIDSFTRLMSKGVKF